MVDTLYITDMSAIYIFDILSIYVKMQ